jgi:hypothetical protein
MTRSPEETRMTNTPTVEEAAPRPIAWLDNADVADRYGVSVHTVRGWRRRRVAPPAHKIGGKVLYRLDELEAWERTRADDPARLAG